MWHEAQILPPDYVDSATTSWSSGGFSEEAEYDYLWWVFSSKSSPAFFAADYGGQYLWIIPMDLIVVTTAEYWLPPAIVQDDRLLITDFVMPAVVSGVIYINLSLSRERKHCRFL